MIHETFLCLTETAFGSHPCRVVSVTYRKLRPFHGGNTGSNPVGDANIPKDLQESALENQGPFGSNELLDCRRDRFRLGTVRHDQLRNLGLSVPLHRRDRLGVRVCCDFESCVTQQLLDGLEVFAVGFHQGSKTVPQGVPTDFRRNARPQQCRF